MTHWASKYVGIPWESGARGPEAFDCWGLVWAIQREVFGREIPSFPVNEWPDHPTLEFAKQVRAVEASLTEWKKIELPERDGDIVLMNGGLHVGVFTSSDGGLLIHSRRSFVRGVRGLSTAQPMQSVRQTNAYRNLEFYTHHASRHLGV